MAQIIKGDEIAAKIFNDIRSEVETLERKPNLAVVFVGDDFSSKSYVRAKKRSGKKAGIDVKVYDYPENTSEEVILDKIEKLNLDKQTDGIIVQLPLPAHLNESKIINSVKASKDVDGFTYYNAGRLFKGQPLFEPCTPKGIMFMLEESGIDVASKNCVVVGRGNLVGLPIARMLTEANATVTLCHSKTKNLEKFTKEADILVVAIGVSKFIKNYHIKDGAVVIDVGISRDKNNKISGDVDFEAVKEVASYISPVPKGVGPLTISMLLTNTLKAYKGEFYDWLWFKWYCRNEKTTPL